MCNLWCRKKVKVCNICILSHWSVFLLHFNIICDGASESFSKTVMKQLKPIISDKKYEILKMESRENLTKSQKNRLRKAKRCSQRPKLPDLPPYRLNTVVAGGSRHSSVSNSVIFLFTSCSIMWPRCLVPSGRWNACTPSPGWETRP